MPLGKLTALQERVLVLLAEVEPRWTLSGGAALAGFHTKHRDTRDLDLFWQGHHTLGAVGKAVRTRLESAGLAVAALETREAFCRLDVRSGTENVILDLVADPVPLADSPRTETVSGATVLVDTPHQILVNKLCALLNRSELRDLEDIMMLLGSGEDLRRALDDCPKQDGGFSSLTLSWSLRALPVERLGTASGWSSERTGELSRFRHTLLDRIVRAARPES